MIDAKCLIIVVVIIAVIILLFFYKEITKIKKAYLPTYQQINKLENSIYELENKLNSGSIKKRQIKKIDSPPLTITYQSDAKRTHNQGTLTVKYANLSDEEVRNISRQVAQSKPNPGQNFPLIETGDLSDNHVMPIHHQQMSNTTSSSTDTDVIDVDVSNLIKLDPTEIIPLEKKDGDKLHQLLNDLNHLTDDPINSKNQDVNK